MWTSRLFRIKSIESVLAEPEESPHALKRVLGPVHLTMLGVGAIVGAGIFALVGTAAAGDGARPGAGPAIAVCFLVTGVACTFTALCYAEFVALRPSPAARIPTPTPRWARSWPGSSAGT